METQEIKEPTLEETINILLAKITSLEQRVNLLEQHRSSESVVTLGMNDVYREYITKEYEKVKSGK